jgi:hypothetical protein
VYNTRADCWKHTLLSAVLPVLPVLGLVIRDNEVVQSAILASGVKKLLQPSRDEVPNHLPEETLVTLVLQVIDEPSIRDPPHLLRMPVIPEGIFDAAELVLHLFGCHVVSDTVVGETKQTRQDIRHSID